MWINVILILNSNISNPLSFPEKHIYPLFHEKKLKISTSDCAVYFLFSLKNWFFDFWSFPVWNFLKLYLYMNVTLEQR